MLGGEDGPRAVAVEGAAFEDPVGTRARQARHFRQPGTDGVVARQVIFAAPAVEGEVGRAPVRARSEDDGGGIAQPDVAEGLDNGPGERGQPPRLGGGGLIGGDQPDLLALPLGGNGCGEGGDLLPRGFEVVLP